MIGSLGFPELLLLLLLGALVALYFMPTIVALRRGANILPILLINLFSGWTVIGWIVALVWALTGRVFVERRAVDAARVIEPARHLESSDSTGRFLRIDDADTSKPVVDETTNPMASKPCMVQGCNGTMIFHERRDVPDAPHTLEWPWYANWRCSQDSTHVELITHAENREIRASASRVGDRRHFPDVEDGSPGDIRRRPTCPG